MARLLEALAGVVGHSHVLAQGDLARFEQDWRRRYHGHALAVVQPASTAEAAAVVRVCAQARREGDPVSLVPQGGNTGLVGGGVPDATGRQIVVSLERMRAVLDVDETNLTLTAQAGCVLQSLQAAAAGAGLHYPLSLASEGSCTLGGTLATNAGGTQVLRYGNARELCLGLEVVTPQGDVWERLQGLRKDNTGYDLRDLYVGSEGTLGLITAATLRLFPEPRARVTGWGRCETLAHAVALMQHLRRRFDAELVAFEAMNAPSLALTSMHFHELALPMAAAPGWTVLFELASPHDDGLLDAAAQRALTEAMDGGELLDVVLAHSAAQAAALWRWRESIPLAQAAEGRNIKHDVAVPLSALARFVDEADAALSHQMPHVRHITFGHLGDGNLHYNLQAPPGTDAAAFLARHEAAANATVHDIATRLGGTFSAEHGIGRLKRGELAAHRSAVHLALMGALKRALDPQGLFNPGVLVPDDSGEGALPG